MAVKHAGWTLIEALIVLAVMGIALVWALPPLQRTAARSRLATASNELVQALYLTQQTAVSLGRHTIFCAGTAGTGCTGNWSNRRWIAFIDYNHDGTLDNNEPVFAVGTINSQIMVSGNGPFESALVFAPIGISQRTSGAFGAGTLRVCSKIGGAGDAIDLVLASTGRVRSERTDIAGGCQAL